VQEAFDYTARRVADSYEAEGTLATEHPQLKGENLGSFEIARLQAITAETPEIAELNAERAALEERIAELRLRREELGDDYLPQLEALLVELARVQERIDGARQP
jgi:cell division protein FtsB